MINSLQCTTIQASTSITIGTSSHGTRISKRFATVVVSGSSKNQGKAKCPGKRRGPKKTASQKVSWDDVLIKQRTWIEPERKWFGGFNVNRGRKGFLNAGVRGRVLYYYDTKQKKK